MFIIPIIIAVVSTIIGIGTFNTLNNEKRGIQFVKDILSDHVVFKRDHSGVYYAKQDEFQLRIKINGDLLQVELENEYFSSGKYHTTFSFEHDLVRGNTQIVKMDSSMVKNKIHLFERLTEKLLSIDWENYAPMEQNHERVVYKEVETKAKEIIFDEEEIQEKANEIKNYYKMIKEEKNSPLNIEDVHNLDRLYTRDFIRLSEAYIQLKSKKETEKEKMLDALDLILGKMKAFEERNESARKNEFEKVVETIRSRK